jgi:transcriptional regulator with XRE-family HTH domain
MRQSGNQLLLSALAACLKARRNELGISQEAAALRADIDRPFWTLVEASRKQPTLSVLHRMAGALEFSLAELCWEVEQRYAALPNLQTGANQADSSRRS